MARAGARTWKIAVLLAVLGLIASCTGGGRHARAEGATGPAAPGANVTAQAKDASRTLVRMAGTIRTWKLDPGVRDQLVAQIGYVVNALEQGNRLGAQTLLAVWKSNAQTLSSVGVLPRPDAGRYQALASEADRELPDSGVVEPFTQPGASEGPDCTKSGTPMWLDAVRVVAVNALKLVPKAGGLLSGFLGVLWPKNDPSLMWRCMRDQLAGMVKKAINDHIKTDLNNYLLGLQNKVEQYVKTADYFELVRESPHESDDEKARARNDVYSAWNALHGDLVFYEPTFKVGSNQPDKAMTEDAYLFLPEYTQFINIYLAALRDGVLHGREYGFSNDKVKRYREEFAGKLAEAKTWTNDVYTAGRAHATNPKNISYRMENRRPPRAPRRRRRILTISMPGLIMMR